MRYFDFKKVAYQYLTNSSPCAICVIEANAGRQTVTAARRIQRAELPARLRPAVVTYNQTCQQQIRLDSCISEAQGRDTLTNYKTIVLAGTSLHPDNKTTQDLYLDTIRQQAKKSRTPITLLWINPGRGCPSPFRRLGNIVLKEFSGCIQELANKVEGLRSMQGMDASKGS